jgi:5'-3' exonuclease
MIALIDADSLVYIIGWNYREVIGGVPEQVHASCDNMLRDILTLTQADQYIGAFSSPKCFRHECYKYNTYKSGRPEKAEWLVYWEPIIKDYFINKYQFFSYPNLEADDVVAAYANLFKDRPWVICSPDKDMKQIPGLHYDYRQKTDVSMDTQVRIVKITEDEADYNFWLQMLTGDEGDAVAGIPGLGPVKAKKLLSEVVDHMMYMTTVRGAYKKYFGPHYGNIIYWETFNTLQLLHTMHTYWSTFEQLFTPLENRLCKPRTAMDNLFDV